MFGRNYDFIYNHFYKLARDNKIPAHIDMELKIEDIEFKIEVWYYVNVETGFQTINFKMVNLHEIVSYNIDCDDFEHYYAQFIADCVMGIRVPQLLGTGGSRFHQP